MEALLSRLFLPLGCRLISEPADCRPKTIAIGYRSQQEHLAALYLASTYAKRGMQVGMVKVPKKLKASFFEGLEGSYNSLIMPENLSLDPDDALRTAKEIVRASN